MATPRQLVETVAEVLGVSVATVIVHDRNLSTAPVPLRTVAGRGRAAAVVTAVDAANLLIAVTASESVKSSVGTVLTYGALRFGSRSTTSGLGVKDPTGIPSIDKLPINHSFGEFLAALIDAVAVNQLRPKEFNATVRLEGPRPAANIEWTFPDKSKKELRFANLRGELMSYELKPKTKLSGESGDLFRTTEFSQETILRVGGVVSLSE